MPPCFRPPSPIRSGRPMNLALNDWKQAWRQVIARPWMSLAIAVTLGLGIGASAAVFSLVYGILLRPYPYRQPDRLVRLETVLNESAGNVRGASIPDLEDLRSRAGAVEGVGAYLAFPNTLTTDGQTHAVNLTFLDARTFPLLGVSPILGRGFTLEEDQLNGDVKKTVLSHGLWRDMFGADPGIIGKVIEARGDRYTVIGVMPPGFRFPEKSDLWIPLMARYAGYREPYWRDRGFRVHDVVARLRPGVTVRQAQSEMQATANVLAQQFPQTNRGTQIRLTPLRDSEVGNVAPYLRLLLAAVAMLVLIGCVNAANLLLARAAAREKEMAVRAALGAGRWRLVRQLLVESLLLSLAGGVLGIALAWGAVKAFPALVPIELPFWMRIELDAQVIGFGVTLSLATGLLFGLSPALQLARVDLDGVLKEGSRGSSAAGGRLRSVLVVAEVALSLVLLCGAALMGKSLVNLARVDMGVKTDHLMVARMARFVPNATQAELAQQYGGSFRRAVEALAQLPGVVSVGVGTEVPYSALEPRGEERNAQQFTIRGQDERESLRNAPTQFASVGPGFFETLQIPLIEGRTFNEADDLRQPVRLIVNRRMAETLWPGQSAVGRQLRWGAARTNPWMTVIGVVENVKYNPIERGLGFETYFFYRQIPIPQMQAIVRFQGGPEAMVGRIRSAIREADAQIAIVHVKTMDSLASETLWQRRLWGVLMSTFAGLALLLASMGLYGVMSYLVSLRTREIGIRMALGARRHTVLMLVAGHGMRLALMGVGIGLVGAFAVGRLMRGLLFGVGGSDPATLIGAPLVLLLVALAACSVPALRATRVDPLTALRGE
jgi:putative ABC transport system permease protein